MEPLKYKLKPLEGVGNKLISDSLESALNERTKLEQDSAQIYFAMGSWCRFNGFNNVAKYFFKHGNEELSHGQKVIDYLDDKNCMAQIPVIARPDISKYKVIKNLFEISFEHEKVVTKSYNDLATMALRESDHDVYRFAQTVLAEQVEELALVSGYLDVLALLGDGPQSDFLFDESFE